MEVKVCSPTTRICAMCVHWNGHQGGEEVKPRAGMMRVWEYNPEEQQVCLRKHLWMTAWHSCSNWTPRYS